MHLLNQSIISINDCFSTGFEMLTYLNQMIFIYLGHCANYGGCQILQCYGDVE